MLTDFYVFLIYEDKCHNDFTEMDFLSLQLMEDGDLGETTQCAVRNVEEDPKAENEFVSHQSMEENLVQVLQWKTQNVIHNHAQVGIMKIFRKSTCVFSLQLLICCFDRKMSEFSSNLSYHI